MKTAAVTMCYNEERLLPKWIEYYASAVGRENIFIINHGSTDSTSELTLPYNSIRLPRKDLFDEVARRNFVQEFCNLLLREWETVIFCDTDEFLVPLQPNYDLGAYLKQRKPAVTWATGVNLIHMVDRENEIDFAAPILEQRRFCQMIASMAKPLVTSEKIQWSPGFHFCNHKPDFSDLLLIHLKLFDRKHALDRLEVTQGIRFVDENMGTHWRKEAEWMKSLFNSFSKKDCRDLTNEEVENWSSRIFNSAWCDEKGIWRFPLETQSETLYRLPQELTKQF